MGAWLTCVGHLDVVPQLLPSGICEEPHRTYARGYWRCDMRVCSCDMPVVAVTGVYCATLYISILRQKIVLLWEKRFF